MVPKTELEIRLRKLRDRLNKFCPDWQVAVVTQKVSLYYLTGTMPSGALWINRDGDATLFIRRGYERAVVESKFEPILPMNSFRDMAGAVNNTAKTVWLEKNSMPIGFFELFNRYFGFEKVEAIDPHLLALRAVKSDFEIQKIRQAGKIHAEIMEQVVPQILREGMSEAELCSQLLKMFIDAGADGMARFNAHDTSFLLGYVGFGDSSIFPTNFDGPDGNAGLNAAAPFMGSRERRLQKGDLVFIDVGCGYEGYFTDKTSLYCYKAKPSDEILELHNKCVDVMHRTASMLKPGNVPSKIYEQIISGLDDDFRTHFMGYGKTAVKFLGHGVGLHIDEPPAIANRFDEPLEENMVFALEPKKAIEGIGMVGTENTFIVRPDGGEMITGERTDIIEC